MKSVHISQFYSCGKVELPCELFYISEISKYLYLKYQTTLNVDGIVLGKIVRNSEYFNYYKMMCDFGYIVNHNLSDTEYDPEIGDIMNVLYTQDDVPFDKSDHDKREMDNVYAFETPQKRKIIIKDKEKSFWHFVIDSSNISINIRSLTDEWLSRQLWVSFLAYIATRRFVKNYPEQFLVTFNHQIISKVGALSYVLLLDNMTNCLDGWFGYFMDETVSAEEKRQLGYFAWYDKGVDEGYHKEPVMIDEKKREFYRLGLDVGDIILFYKRKYKQLNNNIKEIESCRFAKIVSFNKTNITLEFINTSKTYFTGKYEFEDNTTIVKAMYKGNRPYEKLNTSVETTDWVSCGIGQVFYDELSIIVPLEEGDDETIAKIPGESKYDYKEIKLTQNELLYWILKDYNYKFNEEKFLKKYFKDRTPLYTLYTEQGVLPKEVYVE